MQGTHLICSVNRAKHFFLNGVIKVKSQLWQCLLWQSSLKGGCFYQNAEQQKQERHLHTTAPPRQQGPARTGGQVKCCQHKGYKIWERDGLCTSTPSVPALRAPPRTNTAFELELNFKLEILEKSKLSTLREIQLLGQCLCWLCVARWSWVMCSWYRTGHFCQFKPKTTIYDCYSTWVGQLRRCFLFPVKSWGDSKRIKL